MNVFFWGFFFWFFLSALLKVPLPIASLCYLTDSSLFLPRRCSSAFPVGACQAPAPSRSVPLQRGRGSTIPVPGRQARRSHCVDVNRRRTKNGCQTAFRLLKPFIAKILLTRVQVSSTPKAYYLPAAQQIFNC